MVRFVLLLTSFVVTLALGYRKYFPLYTIRESNSARDSDAVCGIFSSVNLTSTSQVAIALNVSSVSNVTLSDHFLTIRGRGHYGRLGNRLRSLNKLVQSADTDCCGLSIPPDILDGWHPLVDTTFVNLNNTCRTHLQVNQSTCASKSKSAQDLFYLNIDEQRSACYAPLMQRYFQINSTHALGKECSERPHVVLHVRAGDITRGSFNTTTGTWVPGRVHRGYFPFPTSYYLMALNNMKKRAISSTIFYVLCEDSGNPACDYFLKTTLFAEVPLRVRIGKPLLEDVHLLLCANEVVVSNGSFKNILSLSSKKQVVHNFILDPRACPSKGTSRSLESSLVKYYIADRSQRRIYAESQGKWSNTGHERFLVNKYYAIQTCDSVSQHSELNSSSFASR